MKKKIEEIKEAIYNCSDAYCENREEVRKAINLLEGLEKQFSLQGVRQWVVCKEEPPKEDGDYLINWDGTVIEAGYYVEQNLWHDYTVSEYKDVTHWMRLPKPPCA